MTNRLPTDAEVAAMHDAEERAAQDRDLRLLDYELENRVVEMRQRSRALYARGGEDPGFVHAASALHNAAEAIVQVRESEAHGVLEGDSR